MLNFGQLLFAGVAGYTAALIELNTSLGHFTAIVAGICSGTFSGGCGSASVSGVSGLLILLW